MIQTGLLATVKLRLIVSLVIVLISACGSPSTDPAQLPSEGNEVEFGPSDSNQVVFGPAQRVRVATFNVRKFFDVRCDTRNCSGSYELAPSESEFLAKAQQLAMGIEQLDADIVLLQELESVECLDAIQESFAAGPYPVSELAETNDLGSLDVAILARGEFANVFSHTAVTFNLEDGRTQGFARDLQEVHLRFGDRLVIAFNAHFVSKRTDEEGIWRRGEADAARKIILGKVQQYPNALIVFGGDLNDTPDSETIRTIEKAGQFRRVAAELGEAAGTHTYDEKLQALDHLYIIDSAGGRYVDGSAQVVRTGERGLAGSDHAALLAEFEL